MDIYYIANPNHVGEELRDQVFIRHNKRDLGGYNFFALDPAFVKLESSDDSYNEIVDIFVRIAPSNGSKALLFSKTSMSRTEYAKTFAEVAASIKIYSDDNTVVAWYWDGEGILFFAHDGKAVINTDCKKESGWQWVMW